MKSFLFVLSFSLLFLFGCNKQTDKAITAPANPEIKSLKTVSAEPNGPAKLVFEETVHDFGKMYPSDRVSYNFKFKNAGTGLLKINNVHATCGCTTPELDKKEYLPGETGFVTVRYHSPNINRLDTKHIFVESNDRENPKITLTIKAQVTKQIAVLPEKINLSLREPNAGCPEIILKSNDNFPFSIKKIESTCACFTFDFDPTVQATEYILKPKVDVEKLRIGIGLEGNISIDTSHPTCDSLLIPYAGQSEFQVEPKVITMRDAEPNVPINSQITIKSIYKEPFEIEKIDSRFGCTKVVEQVKDPDGGIILELSITPPPITAQKKKMFSDILSIRIKDGELFKISCRGFYAKRAEPIDK